jgi:hypothetical protein
LLHRHGLRIVAIFDIGQIAAEFLDQGNEFGNFLLGEQAHLEIELRALLRQLALAGLGNQDNRSGQPGAEPNDALQPVIGSGIEGSEAKERGTDVAEQPPRNKEDTAIQKGRPPYQRPHKFDGPSIAAYRFVCARMERLDGRDILVDVVWQHGRRFVLRDGRQALTAPMVARWLVCVVFLVCCHAGSPWCLCLHALPCSELEEHSAMG